VVLRYGPTLVRKPAQVGGVATTAPAALSNLSNNV